MPYLASLDRRASGPVSSSPMGRHPRAARLFVVVTVVALLVGTSSLLAGRPELRPIRTLDGGEGGVVHLPQLEGLLSNLSRLSVSELRRGIERSRPLPIFGGARRLRPPGHWPAFLALTAEASEWPADVLRTESRRGVSRPTPAAHLRPRHRRGKPHH